MDILSNPRNAIVVAHFTMACAFSRAHIELAKTLYDEYGEKGPLISGVMQAHFPERYKIVLREFAQKASFHSDAARAAKPARMHNRTVNEIGRLVAQRDGTGRYGPQP